MNATAETPREYLLLWWTGWFDEYPFENRLIENCGLPYQCRMTHDRSKYNQAKVILFHAQNVYSSLPLPDEQDTLKGEKAWVLNSLEAPQTVEYDQSIAKLFSHRWTVTRNVDFPDSYFKSGIDGLLHTVLQKPRVSLEEKNRRRRLPREQGGLAPVSWVVSNCNAANFRANYVEELAKHIDVDIYGRCNHLPWPTNEDGKPLTIDEVVEPYKFYLSFENSNCDDYVTEKLYRPLVLGNVPVVDGPQDYSRFSPAENALIQTDNFTSAAELAKYLKKLDMDDEAYMSHLRYRVPKDSNRNATLEDLSPSFVKEWYNQGRDVDWGIDGHGANCKVCKFAHDMEEGLYTLDANKRIGPPPNCVRGKHIYVVRTNVTASPSNEKQPPLPPSGGIDRVGGQASVVEEDVFDAVWVYYILLPIMMVAIAVFIVMFSKRFRRYLHQSSHSEGKGYLLADVPDYDDHE
ncbi:hypothetical protein BGZ73_007699 [Actinomortierella ambigua]|nr:hypothetical protein BGZ73_007699 [Actinomortierella ambigua]